MSTKFTGVEIGTIRSRAVHEAWLEFLRKVDPKYVEKMSEPKVRKGNPEFYNNELSEYYDS